MHAPFQLLVCLFTARLAWSYQPPSVTWTNLLSEKDATTYVNSMPIGNGGLAASVFVDNKDEREPVVGILISDQRAWNEAGEIMKVGEVTYHFSPSPWTSGSKTTFKQVLNSSIGTVSIDIGNPPTRIVAYVDANDDVLAVNISSPTKVTITATAKLLRPSPSRLKPQFDCLTYDISADFYVPRPNGITGGWGHANNGSNFVASTLKQLNLESASSSFGDRLRDRSTVAIWRFSESMSGVSDGVVRTEAKVNTLSNLISVVTREEGAISEAIADAEALVDKYKPLPAWKAHVYWWKGFWETSWISISGKNATRVSEKYALQRYLQGLQARQPFPIKFNGMLFTAQRNDPDYRQWGGLNWWQNLRAPYYNMLPAGDFAMQQTLFEAYKRTLNGTMAKTALYYPHMKGPTAFWDEYVHPLIGTTHPDSYGCGRAGSIDPPIWYAEDRWNHFNLQGALDLCLLMLDHYAWTKDRDVLKANLPLMDAVINFFSQWRTAKDVEGRMVLFPAQAIETWQCPGYKDMVAGKNCSKNDQPTISGLWAVVTRLVKLPYDLTLSEQRLRWKKLLSVLPLVPLTKAKTGGWKLAPCEVCSPRPANVENADLYAVHPYRIITAKSRYIQVGRITFKERRFTSDVGWEQNVMDAALLGLAKTAQSLVVARAELGPAKGYRFPVFAPHLQDYPPSADHYAVMNNAMTYMLLQPMDDKEEGIMLFPAWPCDWDVNFKLWGPANTVIEGSLVGGNVTELHIEPEHRSRAVIVMPCQ
ncbi:hypothetical protein Pmar_PMAR015892 [Perkinsus marinus ATCC 50983]|uniref:Uncharacterized protein n=1 Tax=Perkinsus marinus (strain ATCC 50983 / TXsc) TaxID=423536 RepID=C5KQE9_PERM5|nr:hypothetical protein Pmar_PMAR015892 [Perkinsus marinus ATCC 50983]EER13294.1 hypothetical protein Pmar_PMAR015892 [Perkinsus marinus ATCC 50983]|eukprot:XP_002781499.1 hypothetical protein Pmar_PMAR015892 [Perkinsus marinus ATCC 50983]